MDKLEKFCKCDVCLQWIALHMVEPLRGYPTEEYRHSIELQKDFERLKFLENNRDILISHGSYDSLSEEIKKM